MIILLIFYTSTTKSYENDEYTLTGLTVYSVYPFKSYSMYNLDTIFIKNNPFSNIEIESQWTTPFSFNSSMEKMIIDRINNITNINQDSILKYERNTSSLNEFIFFRFNEDPDYYCVIFPTMVIGIGKLTETGEYIRINEMNQRRDEFLSYFAQFIFDTKNLKFYFQQDEFLSDETLPRESMVWTHIIRMDPNFNYLTEQQLFELQHFRTYDFLIEGFE